MQTESRQRIPNANVGDRRPCLLRSWLRLLRIPNLFTVPAEPVAGFVLVSAGRVPDWLTLGQIVAAMLCIYAAGLIWNDVHDRRKDAQNRLLRPIPMGLIAPGTASVVAWLLAGTGWGLCWWVGPVPAAYGICLIGCVISYDRFLKTVPVVGVLNMGLCRGISLLIGAAAASPQQLLPGTVWVAALAITAYVASVTQLAKRERRPHNPSMEVWGPAIATILGILFFIPTLIAWSGWLVGLLLVLLAVPIAAGGHLHGFRTTRNLPRTLECKERIVTVLPPWIGYLIAHLLCFSMFFVLSTGVGIDTVTVCGILIVCWVLNRVLARFFYAS